MGWRIGVFCVRGEGCYFDIFDHLDIFNAYTDEQTDGMYVRIA